ncbi:MAG: hypothetical protein R3D28_01965 [Geminicoccaceae bacterium]
MPGTESSHVALSRVFASVSSLAVSAFDGQDLGREPGQMVIEPSATAPTR